MDLTILNEVSRNLAIGIAIGFGVMGPGLGIGLATKALLESMARQPEMSGRLLIFFLVGAALAETCAIYAFAMALLLMFNK